MAAVVGKPRRPVLFLEQVAQSQFVDDSNHNLQVIFKSLEGMVVIMRVLGKDKIIDRKLG